MCAVLGVSRSGYYDWLDRVEDEPRGRAAEDQLLLAEIRQIHLACGYYGTPRIHQELLSRNHHVGRHRVARLMRPTASPPAGARSRPGRAQRLRCAGPTSQTWCVATSMPTPRTPCGSPT